MIKWIVITLLALIILGYFGLDIRKAIDSPATKNNIQYVKEVVVYLWTQYLERPIKYLWDLFIKLVWNTSINNLKGIKSDHSTTTPSTES